MSLAIWQSAFSGYQPDHVGGVVHDPTQWPVDGAATDYATVSNEPVDTIVDLNNYYFGSYSRGYLAAKKSTKDSSQVLQSVKVKATVYQGNSGVTATLISPSDQSLALSTELAVKIDTGVVTQPLLTVTGKVECLEKQKQRSDSQGLQEECLQQPGHQHLDIRGHLSCGCTEQ